MEQGRPKLFDEPMMQFSITIPQSMMDDIEKRRLAEGCSRAAYLRKILDSYLKTNSFEPQEPQGGLKKALLTALEKDPEFKTDLQVLLGI